MMSAGRIDTPYASPSLGREWIEIEVNAVAELAVGVSLLGEGVD